MQAARARQSCSAGALAPSGGHRPEQQRPALPLPPAVGPWPALAWGPWPPPPPPLPPTPRLLTPLPGSALRGRMGAGGGGPGRGGATLARSARTLTPQDTIPLRDLRHPASWESGGPAAGPSAALGPGMRAREQGPPRGFSLLPGCGEAPGHRGPAEEEQARAERRGAGSSRGKGPGERLGPPARSQATPSPLPRNTSAWKLHPRPRAQLARSRTPRRPLSKPRARRVSDPGPVFLGPVRCLLTSRGPSGPGPAQPTP